jgi:hypothetical protein
VTLLIVTPPPSKPFDATIRHNGDMMCEHPASIAKATAADELTATERRKLDDEAGTLMAQLI